MRVTIPGFTPTRNISAPAGTLLVNLVIAVAAAKLSTDTSSGFQSQIIEIPFNKEEIPSKILDFPVPTVKGTIIVTAARLVYTGLKNNYPYIIDKQKFKPAGVINAAYC